MQMVGSQQNNAQIQALRTQGRMMVKIGGFAIMGGAIAKEPALVAGGFTLAALGYLYCIEAHSKEQRNLNGRVTRHIK